MKLRIAAVAMLVAAPAMMAQQPRVFLAATSTGSSSTVNNDQTVPMRQGLTRYCGQFISTTVQANADFTVFDAHQEQGILIRVNQFTVSNANGDVIGQFNAGSILQGMQQSCAMMGKAWANRPPAPPPQPEPVPAPAPAPAADVAPAAAPAPAPEMQRVAITSVPEGADIIVDNKFMGNTPSTVMLPMGDHTVMVSKNEYDTWQREITLSGGTIKLSAELVKAK